MYDFRDKANPKVSFARKNPDFNVTSQTNNFSSFNLIKKKVAKKNPVVKKISISRNENIEIINDEDVFYLVNVTIGFVFYLKFLFFGKTIFYFLAHLLKVLLVWFWTQEVLC